MQKKVLAICCQDMWCQAVGYILEHGDYFEVTDKENIELATLAGAASVLATNASRGQADLAPELHWRIMTVGVGAHGCDRIVLFGHTDCVGNPGTTEFHRRMVRSGVSKLECWNNRLPVVGVLLNKEGRGWQAEEVCLPEKR